MFESDAIVYICTYHDIALTGLKIFIADIAANYFAVSDAFRPVMINNTNSVPNPFTLAYYIHFNDVICDL